MASVAVVGLGAVGGTVAAHLAAAERHEVVGCVRSPVAELRVEELSGRTLNTRIRQVTRPQEAGLVDWVLLATKAHQTRGAAPWLTALAGPETRVVVLQNGVEHEERVAPLTAGRIVPAVVEVNAEPLGGGHIRQNARPRLIVADGVDGVAFRELLAGTGVSVQLTADILTEAWRKLCLNVANGAVTALTGQRIGVFRRPPVADLGLALVEEACQVGRAAGAQLPAELPRVVMDTLLGWPPEAGSSMLWARLAGRRLEYDARNGAVVRAGERAGIPTPYNRTVTALLSAINETTQAT